MLGFSSTDSLSSSENLSQMRPVHRVSKPCSRGKVGANTWRLARMLCDAALPCCYSPGNDSNCLTHHPAWRMPELHSAGMSWRYTCRAIVLSLASRSGTWASALLRTAPAEHKIKLKRETQQAARCWVTTQPSSDSLAAAQRIKGEVTLCMGGEAKSSVRAGMCISSGMQTGKQGRASTFISCSRHGSEIGRV